MAASLLTKLSGGVELSCAFDHVEVQLPNPQNPAGPPATWRVNGTLRLRTRGADTSPAPGPSSLDAPAAPVAPAPLG